MKNKWLIVLTSIVFVVINTTYYWEGKLVILAFPAFLLLVVIYVGLCLALFRQIYLSVKERLSDKPRIITIGFMSIMLALMFYKPFGLVNFDKLQGEDLLVARREGVANCHTIIKLKDTLTFRERGVCFGVSVIEGTYRISNDTIFFENTKLSNPLDSYYEFAVIEEFKHYTENQYGLKLFKNKGDTIGLYFPIGKNDLDIKPTNSPSL